MVYPVHALREALAHHATWRKILLGCGVVSSMWWVTADIIGSLRYPGYSYLDQTISELSAEGAPTRLFMMVFSGIPYSGLLVAFGVGVLTVAGQTRTGRMTGSLLVVGAAIGMAGGLLFPMMVRGNDGDLRNIMHVPYGAVSMLLFLVTMVYGSQLLGTKFRYYTYATIVTWLMFGVLMSLQSGRMVADEPTPWMGLEERMSVFGPMLWYGVLAIALLRAEGLTIPKNVRNLHAASPHGKGKRPA